MLRRDLMPALTRGDLMPGILKTASAAALLLIVVACSAAPATTSTPAGGTTAPTQAATATAVSTQQLPPTAPPVGGGSECSAFPTFNLASPVIPSFTPDPVIVALFPAEIDGQPVTNVQSASWIQTICFYGGQAKVDQLKATASGGALLANLTFGSATANVGGSDVNIAAFRLAGQDGNAILQNASLFVAGLTGQTPEPFTTTQTNLGGKAITILTDSGGDITYAYVKGDTVITIDNADATQAATILAALP
jgi:hypothetical protein